MDKVQETHPLSLIMLKKTLIEKKTYILNLHITIPTLHPIQISSHSDTCITSVVMYKNLQKMTKNH